MSILRKFQKKDVEEEEEEFTITRNDAPAVKVEQAAKPKPKGTVAGGGAVLELLQGQFGNLNKRGRIALELLTTERVYCECLTSTINAFLIPLRTGLCPSFDKRYLPAIFMNIDKILIANTKFLHEIEYLVFSPRFSGDVAMDEALQHLIPALKLYPEYVKGHDNAIMLVNKLEDKDPEFKNFLIRAKECSDAKLDLLACLIAPVQRVPRYRLLLEELQKNTSDEYPDKPKLKEILTFVCDMADSVNRDMRKQENLQKQIRVLRAFVGNQPPIQPSTSRTLIRYGPLERRVRYGTLKTRWFFLFSDCLIYGKINRVDSIFGHEPFEGKLFALSQILHNVTARETPSQSDTAEFEIISQEKSFTCVAENMESKKQWLQDIASLKSEGSAQHAPIWVADTATEGCMLCGEKFTLTLRRHHCRCCGVVVCGQCSHTRAKLPNMEAMVRVCDKCAETLKEKRAPPRTLQKANHGFHKLMSKLGPHDSSQQQRTPRTGGGGAPKTTTTTAQPVVAAAPAPASATAAAETPVQPVEEKKNEVEEVKTASTEEAKKEDVVVSTSENVAGVDDDDDDSDVESAPKEGQLLLLDFSDLKTESSQTSSTDPFSQPPETPSATDILLGDADYSALDLLMEQSSPSRDGVLGKVTTSELLSFLEITGSSISETKPSTTSSSDFDPFASFGQKDEEPQKEQADAEPSKPSSDPFAVIAHMEIPQKQTNVDSTKPDVDPFAAPTTTKEEEKPKEEGQTEKPEVKQDNGGEDNEDPFAVDTEPTQQATTATGNVDDEDPFADPFASETPNNDGGDDDDDNPFAIEGAQTEKPVDTTTTNDDPFADMIDTKQPQATTKTETEEDDADNPFNI